MRSNVSFLLPNIYFVMPCPDLKNSSDQTCSCPRDSRLSASWGANWGPPLEPPVHHSTIVLRGLRGLLIKAELCLETSQCKFFQWRCMPCKCEKFYCRIIEYVVSYRVSHVKGRHGSLSKGILTRIDYPASRAACGSIHEIRSEILKKWHMIHRLCAATNCTRGLHLDIMGDRLRAPLNPLNTIVLHYGPKGFRVALNLTPIMSKDASLSDSCKSDHCSFFKLAGCNGPYISG